MEAAKFVVDLNLRRRHLSASQRAMAADRLATLRDGQRADRDTPIGDSATQADAAEQLNVGKRSVESARLVRDHGSPELIAAVEQGGVSVSAAADIAAALPQEVQSKIAALGEPLDFDPTDAKFLGYRGGSRALAHRSAHTARAGLPAKLAGDR